LTQSATLNISVSNSNQQTGKRQLGRFSSKIINYGVDTTYFSPNSAQRHVREELGISPDLFLFGFLARMTIQKDPLCMIRAFKQVADKHPDTHLLMVGDGELRTDAENLSASLELTDRVTFAGFRQDVPDVLQALDVYCLPSLWEGLPIGLLEAMSMQKPVIASRVDGSSEPIQPGQTGMLVPPMQPDKLAEAMIYLYTHEKERNSMAHGARGVVQQNYSLGRMAKNIEDTYYQVLRNQHAHVTANA
jgi:glycosyltransferase involved in cell wall biosynthesis